MIVKKPVTGCLVERGGYYHTLLNVYVNGKRKQISRTTGLPVKNNYRKALKVLEDRKKEYDIAGLPGMLSLEERQRAGSMLLSEHMHRWSEKRKSEISPLTYQSYMGMIDGRIKSFFDPLGVTLSTVTPQLIDDFLESVGDAGCNSSTQQRYYQVLNTCLKHAVKKDLLDRNPIEKVDRPKKAKFHASYFSDEEALRLLECAKTDYCYIPILLSTYYGLRRSEAIGLQWSSVDFDNNQIHIDHKAYCGKVKGKSTVIITTDMKTETSRRTLPLISFVREELLRHKAQQESYRKAFGKGYSREWTDCVCVDAVGKIISPEKLTSHFPDFLEANNLRKIRFHDLRHTCASLMVAQGINIKHIQLWLGHSNYSTTADTYSHLNPHAMDVPADCISELLNREEKKEVEDE